MTALLGPNSAGKSTALRILLGLARPTAGEATVGGRAYADLERPARQVGATLDSLGARPQVSARDHLRVLAATGDIPAERVDLALEEVGLTDAAPRKVGGYGHTTPGFSRSTVPPPTSESPEPSLSAIALAHSKNLGAV